MGRFLESEKRRQVKFKSSPPYFSEPARLEGVYKNKLRPFCLPLGYAEQNLVPEIQGSALEYFAKNNIKWHDGQNGKPSNHLCDSQVCCINFLFPFADKPAELAQVFHLIYPEIGRMLPVESGQFVSFEWIGQQNYLGEKVAGNRRRTRGANFTSADAIVMFERKDKQRQVVLIEWKYTESYGSNFLKYAKSGTDRTEIYRHLFERDDCPINKDILPGFDDLFYEPFYQLMRQQFLANEMEKVREVGADVVSILHIAPAHNKDFYRITSPELKKFGDSATAVWKNLVKNQDKFTSISTEQLFGDLTKEQLPGMISWLEYVNARYPWIGELQAGISVDA
jgi:hypothetical protein